MSSISALTYSQPGCGIIVLLVDSRGRGAENRAAPEKEQIIQVM